MDLMGGSARHRCPTGLRIGDDQELLQKGDRTTRHHRHNGEATGQQCQRLGRSGQGSGRVGFHHDRGEGAVEIGHHGGGGRPHQQGTQRLPHRRSGIRCHPPVRFDHQGSVSPWSMEWRSRPLGQVRPDHHQYFGRLDGADGSRGGVRDHRAGRKLQRSGDGLGRLLLTGHVVDVRRGDPGRRVRGGSMSQPPACSFVETAAAAPVTSEALATRTGTRLGGSVVVVVGGWAGRVVAVDELTVDSEVGWMTPSNSTVATTNATSTISARTTGNLPPRPPEAAGGRAARSGGWATTCQPANPWMDKQVFPIGRAGPSAARLPSAPMARTVECVRHRAGPGSGPVWRSW